MNSWVLNATEMIGSESIKQSTIRSVQGTPGAYSGHPDCRSCDGSTSSRVRKKLNGLLKPLLESKMLCFKLKIKSGPFPLMVC